jgi:tripartite-type tricarboxylate transporter receptor subunit TctC
MRKRPFAFLLFCAVAAASSGTPASAQFYKDKTLTLLVNYGAGGNADTEARVYQHYLPKYIPGNPNVIIENSPGAGGLKAMNMLGLHIGSKADGLTAGYFTIGALAPIIDDPALEVKLYDFVFIGAARGWTLAYGRKDIPPNGIKAPADLAKATKLFGGGYSRSSSHDTQVRLTLEIFGRPYTMVTGFPGTAELNKAMLQNEVNFSVSSLPGYQTQVLPDIIQAGIGLPFFQYTVVGPNGEAVANPSLEKQGIHTLQEVYKQAFGKEPSGPKYQALILMTDIGSELQRGLVLPQGSPDEAVKELREGFQKTAADPNFIAEYKKVTGETPDLVRGDELEPLFERMRHVDPAIKQVLIDSINGS